jgi:hypothetical protein
VFTTAAHFNSSQPKPILRDHLMGLHSMDLDGTSLKYLSNKYHSKKFIRKYSWANVIKLFMSVIYVFSYQAIAFVHGKLFKHGLTNILALYENS